MIQGQKGNATQQAHPMVGNLFTNIGPLGNGAQGGQKGGERGSGASTNIGGKKQSNFIPSLQGSTQAAGNYHQAVHSTTNKGQTRGGRSFSRATDGGVSGGSAGLTSPKNYRTIYNSN